MTRKETLAANLRTLRQKHGLTLAEVGEMTGIHWSTIANWERGYHGASVFPLAELADFYGVSVDWLIGRADRAGNLIEEAGK